MLYCRASSLHHFCLAAGDTAVQIKCSPEERFRLWLCINHLTFLHIIS